MRTELFEKTIRPRNLSTSSYWGAYSFQLVVSVNKISMNKVIIIFLAFSLICSACTTYDLSLNTLKNRFEGIDSTDLVLTKVRGPLGETYSYYTHPNRSVQLKNKAGEVVALEVKPSLEMKVTHDGGKKTYFYFDKVYITEDSLIGDRSRFMNAFKKKIAIKAIEKIEVQDGKKNFQYY